MSFSPQAMYFWPQRYKFRKFYSSHVCQLCFTTTWNVEALLPPMTHMIPILAYAESKKMARKMWFCLKYENFSSQETDFSLIIANFGIFVLFFRCAYQWKLKCWSFFRGQELPTLTYLAVWVIKLPNTAATLFRSIFHNPFIEFF